MPRNWSVPWRKAVLSPATNIPRKTRLGTLMGRKKERREDPAGVVRGEAARGKRAVDMGMMLQALIPGVSMLKKPISAPR